MVYSLARRLLFMLDAELAHRVTLKSLNVLDWFKLLSLYPKPIDYPVELLGLTFKNPVGLAAGLDKNGDYIDSLGALGFGFIEIGTVTPQPQIGNPRPRLFRLPKSEAIINRMGFNNKGVDYLVERVKQRKYSGVLGINIGKNKVTSNERAVDDYLTCLRKVYDYADYVVVNISSPNTPGLRDLQQESYLTGLLGTLKREQLHLAQKSGRQVPMLVKIAPDLNRHEIEVLADIVVQLVFDGVIATNTTIEKEAVSGQPNSHETGGLSGRPLFVRSNEVVRQLAGLLPKSIPIIGCGGICTDVGAKQKIEAGAQLVQIYSGLIYQGPGLIRACVKSIKSLR